jgi:glutamate synthase domain-containing protein 3
MDQLGDYTFQFLTGGMLIRVTNDTDLSEFDNMTYGGKVYVMWSNGRFKKLRSKLNVGRPIKVQFAWIV